MLMSDALHDVSGRIAFEEGSSDQMTLENLEIASPLGCTMLDERKVEVKAGEHVLVVGEPGAGKTLAVSSARGPVALGRGPHLPAERRHRLFHPAPTVRCPRYSARGPGLSGRSVETFDPQAFTDALDRVGLPRLAPMLDRASRWDRELNWDEQQYLMLARLLIHRPRWVVARRGAGCDRRRDACSRARDSLQRLEGRRRYPHRPRQRSRSLVHAPPAPYPGSRDPQAGVVKSPRNLRDCHPECRLQRSRGWTRQSASGKSLWMPRVWSPVAAGEAQLALSSASAGGRPALRLDFDFKGGRGFVVARRPVQHEVCEDYTVTFRLRGMGRTNNLEFKLVDSTGQNVWRHVQGTCGRPHAGNAFKSTAASSSSPGDRRAATSRRISERSSSRSSPAKVAPVTYMGQRPQDRGSQFADGRAGERLERPPGLRRRSGTRRVRLDPQSGGCATLDRRGLHRAAQARRAHHRLAGRRACERIPACEHRRVVGVGGRFTRRRVRAAHAATSTCRT